MIDSGNSFVRGYYWGGDLSGSLQSAGGVGGLLIAVPSSGLSHFAAYDGNGNVFAYVSESTGLIVAQDEYGPFGEVIRATSTINPAIPIRWSTKYQDLETDLVYYGRRYYNPSTGRWLSRDPIGEQGGLNLYAFARNNAVNLIDRLGLCTPGCHRAGCAVRIVPAGYSPDTSQKIEELAALYTATERFGILLATGETAAAGLGEIEAAVATGIGHAVGHGLSTPGEAIAETAKELLERLGDHNGWVPWIHVSYQACLSRCALGGWWTGDPGYWKDLSGSSKDWEPVKGPIPLTDSFDSPEGALAAGLKQCKERTADFRAAHKVCD